MSKVINYEVDGLTVGQARIGDPDDRMFFSELLAELHRELSSMTDEMFFLRLTPYVNGRTVTPYSLALTNATSLAQAEEKLTMKVDKLLRAYETNAEWSFVALSGNGVADDCIGTVSAQIVMCCDWSEEKKEFVENHQARNLIDIALMRHSCAWRRADPCPQLSCQGSYTGLKAPFLPGTLYQGGPVFSGHEIDRFTATPLII